MARHRVRVVDRARLAEVHPEAPTAHVHGRDGSRWVELPDSAHGAVRHVQGTVARPELDAVAHREALLLDPLHLEGPPLLRVDDAHQVAPLQLQPQEVLSLVDRDHAPTLAGVDPVTATDEPKHVAVAKARRPPLLLGRKVLLDHDGDLDALPLHLAGFDQRLADAAVQVHALGVARGDDDATATVRDEIPRDPLVPLARIRDLHHTAALFEEPHGKRGAATLGRGQDNVAESFVALPADHVEALGRELAALDQHLERRAGFDGAVLRAVADEHHLGAHVLRTFEQFLCLPGREESRLVHDPQLAALSLKGRTLVQ